MAREVVGEDPSECCKNAPGHNGHQPAPHHQRGIHPAAQRPLGGQEDAPWVLPTPPGHAPGAASQDRP